MAGYTDTPHGPHRDALAALQDHSRGTRWVYFYGARRTGRAKQATLPGGNSAEREDQECEGDSEETCHGCKDASRRRSVDGQYEPGIDTRGRQVKSVRLGVVQRRLTTRLPLVPPKPNELESAVPIFILRALFGT